MLTTRESEILAYTAVGLSAKEMAGKPHRSQETIRKTLSNIKQKLGLQKATELTAYYFCERMGKDFSEVRKQILASCLLLLFAIGNIHSATMVRIRQARRINRIEHRLDKREVNITI